MIYRYWDITDPRLRRMRKGLKKAERFMDRSRKSEKAVGRWNKVLNKARRVAK